MSLNHHGKPSSRTIVLDRKPSRLLGVFLLALTLLGVLPFRAVAEESEPRRRFPNVVLISIDTLRYDRLSINGYRRPTSPRIDALLESGIRFDEARVPEALTSPSMCSILTSLEPHEHGASRNALPMRSQLPSMTTVLGQRGYKTAAFVGNWTLKDELTRLGEHFETYVEVLERKRYLGMVNAEATADDLNEKALEWVDQHLEDAAAWPFALWVHYVEPHAPYMLHKDMAERLGIKLREELPPSDLYDTEVAFVDRATGQLIDALRERVPTEDLMILFVSDHGESLGEHGYWGHGRHVYDVTLRVPLGIAWPGKVPPGRIAGLASTLDLAPTVLGILGLRQPESFQGFDWSPVIRGEMPEPESRTTFHQGHKGAMHKKDAQARRDGLLEVGRVFDGKKEILRLKGNRHQLFDLTADPYERKNRVKKSSPASEELLAWLADVQRGLEAADSEPPPSLDAEAIEQLKALGYLDP